MNERTNAIEGKTVRLYLRNYVSNVLTDIADDPNYSPSVTIREKSTGITFASLTGIRESRGVYYVDWTIPSSNPASPRFKGGFFGSGYYQDVWVIDPNSNPPQTFSQDFFVYPEGYDNLVATAFEPLSFDYVLNTPRLEKGAKDFLSVTLREQNSRIIDGEDVFPEGEIRIIKNNTVITNYTPLIHEKTSANYKYFIDTTPLESGIYKIQLRHTIPQETVNKKAVVVSTKSLSQGFTPTAGGSLLELDVDGIRQNVFFPSTAKPAQISTFISEPLDFRDAANDLFIAIIDDTERQRRLLNANKRTISGIVSELNGVFPVGDFNGTLYPSNYTPALPALTPAYEFTLSIATQLDNTDLRLEIDGIPYTVVFQNVSTSPIPRQTVVDQINAVVGSDVAAYYDSSIYKDVLIISKSGANSIKVTGGTAAKILGFVDGQEDASPYGLKISPSEPNIASIDNNKIKLTAERNITILSPSEGSVANETLGFPAGGGVYEGSEAQPVYVQGSQISPRNVILPSPASLTTSFPVTTLLENESNISGDSIEIKTESDASYVVITFEDEYLPGAVVSGFFTQGFSFTSGVDDTLSLLYSTDNGANYTTVTVTFGTSVLDVNNVIDKINDAIASQNLLQYVIADSYQGRLRIRMRKTDAEVNGDQILKINKSASTAFGVLGFEGIADDPEPIFQNDQVIEDQNGDLIIKDYVKKPTATSVVNQLNTALTNAVATLLDNGNITISSNVTGSTSSIEIRNNTTSFLVFSTTLDTGTDGQNYDLIITLDATGQQPVTQSVTFEEGIHNTDYFVQKINSEIIGVFAENVDGAIKISDQIAGSGRTLKLTDSHVNPGANLAGLGFSPVNGEVISNNGTDAVPAVALADNAPGTTYVSTGNGILKIKLNEGDNYTTINLTGVTTGADLANAISNAFPNSLFVNYDNVNSILLIKTLAIGSENAFIRIGSFNEGSTANSSLNLSTDGVEAIGTDGNTLTLDQIVQQINATFGGKKVATNSANFLRLESILDGADSYIEIGNKTTTDILEQLGLQKGKTYGSSDTRLAQTIISPKLTLTIGE